MGIYETPVEMASRHVLEGEKHLADQTALIECLHRKGLPTEDAQALLDRFCMLQTQHKGHLRRILEERELGLRDEDGNLLPLQ